ncbi:unnamed protein product [Lactuca saligna]|uniref:CASP-like protein n=1 Tax=Lactuca saligna TaxID=75948 RepID=A0AA35ZGZ2_LACSI|nr:unnamed protein product [Lactuca saligna]
MSEEITSSYSDPSSLLYQLESYLESYPITVCNWLLNLVTAILALAASSSSAGVMVLLDRDSEYCKNIAFAFLAWFLLAITSHTVLWLLTSLSS